MPIWLSVPAVLSFLIIMLLGQADAATVVLSAFIIWGMRVPWPT